LTFPEPLEHLTRAILPENAMLRLVVPMRGNASAEVLELIQGLSLEPALKTLAWLYVDELERAHEICQSMGDATGAALHAMVHRREGDFGNALYWWHRAGNHPALVGQNPVELTKAVEAGDVSDATIERQREEWSALAVWCAA
jgi:hypothetical protein